MGCCGGRSSHSRGKSRKFVKGTRNKNAKRVNLKHVPRMKHPECPYLDEDMECKNCDRREHCPKFG